MKKLFAASGVLLLIMLAAAAVELTLESREAPPPPAAFAQVGGTKVRYRMTNPDGAGPVVVFVNGIGASLEQWETLQTGASAFAKTLAYDRGGSGFSSGAAGYDVEAQAGELAGLLRVLRVDRPVVLVGYSFSASIARIFASRHPERTAGLVLAEPYFAEIERDAGTRQVPFRRYARWLLHESFVTLFGLRRLNNSRNATPASPHDRATLAVLQRFSHWLAVDREWLEMRASEREVTATPEAAVPEAVIVTSPMTGLSYGPPMMKLYRDFARRSRKGELRVLERMPHEQLLQNPTSLSALTSAIRDVAREP